MDSFTVAPELKGAKGDIVAARIEMPVLFVMIYGVLEFIRLGWSQDHYLYTYAPAASVGLFTYFFLVSVRRKLPRGIHIEQLASDLRLRVARSSLRLTTGDPWL
jgi:hypothetical protein